MCHCICVHTVNAKVYSHFANIPLSDGRPKDLDHAAFFFSFDCNLTDAFPISATMELTYAVLPSDSQNVELESTKFRE